MPRWLFVGDVPSLGGESALALIRLLDGLASPIGSEYVAEIEACRRARRSTSPARSAGKPRRPYEDPQLRLDLGDDDWRNEGSNLANETAGHGRHARHVQHERIAFACGGVTDSTEGGCRQGQRPTDSGEYRADSLGSRGGGEPRPSASDDADCTQRDAATLDPR